MFQARFTKSIDYSPQFLDYIEKHNAVVKRLLEIRLQLVKLKERPASENNELINELQQREKKLMKVLEETRSFERIEQKQLEKKKSPKKG